MMFGVAQRSQPEVTHHLATCMYWCSHRPTAGHVYVIQQQVEEEGGGGWRGSGSAHQMLWHLVQRAVTLRLY